MDSSRSGIEVIADSRVISSDIVISATDGYALAGSLFEPSDAPPSGPLVVIAGGASIQRRFYARLATYIAERGATVVTFDYRTVGGSRHGPLKASDVRMRDWCTLDVPGVLAWTSQTYPGRPIHWLGHSMGGFATGLAHNNHLISRQLNVATLSGYWGRMDSPEKWRVLIMMGGIAPLIVWILGYMPGRIMGGEDMAPRAFMEWRGWCMTPEFLFGDTTLAERTNFSRLTAPLRCIQIADDPWGTEAAVAHMTAHYTGSVARSIWQVKPAEAGVKAIGHFGFFRPELRDTLWKPAADWLLTEQ